MTQSPATLPLWPIVQSAARRAASYFPVSMGLGAAGEANELGVRLDPDTLDEVFASLVVIACQAMGGRSGHVEVSGEALMMDQVVLDENAGKLLGGLPPQHHMLVRISASRAAPAGAALEKTDFGELGGSGPERMSLAEVRDVLSALGGSLTASRQPGQGPSFEVFVPAVTQVERVTTEGVTAPRILYVDDYDMMCAVAAEVLGAAGYDVTCLQDAAEALRLHRSDPTRFAAAVVDYNMPKYSGTDLVRLFREANPKLPVIILSGYVDKALQLRAAAVEANAVVSKDAALGEVVEALHKLVK